MSNEISDEMIKDSWPTLGSLVYLNTASTGVPTKQCIDGVNRYFTARTEGTWGYTDTADLFSDVRSALARLLGGEELEYAFSPSTSVGLNSFGYAIDYPEGSNIVICDLEFPSNYIPWQNLCKIKNVELRVVKSNEGAAPTERFLEQIDENTRVVSVSHVQFSTGYQSDLKAVAEAVHENDGYFVVDIIQSAGCIDFDLKKADVDFAAAQATKWLAGPIGAGFLFVNKKIWEYLKPRFVGWRSVKDHREFGFAERELLDDAGMFHAGSPPMALYAGFRESLKLLLSIDSQAIESKAMDNADYLRKLLREKGIEFYDFGEKHNSPIVSCRPANIEGLEDKLRSEKIYCSERYGRLRVSPHFYNNYSDIEKLVEQLE